MKIRLAMLVGLAVSGLANAATYSVVIPVEAGGMECDARAARVSVLFQSQPEVTKVVATDCLNEFEAPTARGSYRVYTIAVDYEAKDYLNLASATYGLDVQGFESDSFQGSFTDLESCVAARAVESSAFEQATGLPALFVSCLPGRSTVRSGFVLTISGIGEPKSRLFGFGFSRYFRKDDGLSTTQVEWLGRELAALGASVRLNDGATVLFYSENAISQNLSQLASFESVHQCSEQVQDAELIFGKNSLKTLVECQATGSRTRLSAMTLGGWLLSSFTLEQKYSSYESCMKFKPIVAAREKRQNPNRFLGLICAPDIFSGQMVHVRYTTL